MNRMKNLTTPEWIMIIFSGSGILLMGLHRFIETDIELMPIAFGLNGVGIVAFLYSQRAKKNPHQ